MLGLILMSNKGILYSEEFCKMHYCFFNRGRKFVTTCRTLRLAEDLTVGALIGMLAQEYCVAVVVMCALFTLQKVS